MESSGNMKESLASKDGTILLDNWVEQRAVKHIDGENLSLKVGHRGILTTDFDAKAENLTTVRETYKPPKPTGISEEGSRKQLFTKLLYEQIAKEVEAEFHPPPDPDCYQSEMMDHYGGRFYGNSIIKNDDKSAIVPDTIYNEQPATFWTENKEKITGVSQVKTGDTVFRKNSSFSKPIDEYWNETLPYDIENYPKM